MSWRDGESSQHVTHYDDTNDAEDDDESDDNYNKATTGSNATTPKLSSMSSSSTVVSKKHPRDPPGALHQDQVVDEDEHDVVQSTMNQTMNNWQPQDIPSVLEFTHTIEDYAKKRQGGCKKAEYSAVVTDDRGNRWRLIIYVNGNGRASNHHLSLFLQVAQAEELPFGWKKTVSYVLTLEHPNPELRYAKRNPDKTFKMCPKAIDWGWSQFISSDRIQQEGFVQNDTLIITAHVTVKSSDTKILDADSELYLKCAVEEGNADAVQLCLDQGASINCQFKDDLYTPLHTSCSSNANNHNVLFKLLEHGASVDAVNKWKETPLLIAANNGHTVAVETLLKYGSNPSLCSEAGWSALTFAAHKVCDIYLAA
jgi:MATH domain/Ankyrin repeats (many copies)